MVLCTCVTLCELLCNVCDCGYGGRGECLCVCDRVVCVTVCVYVCLCMTGWFVCLCAIRACYT